jgi:hypothetical protein
MRIGTVFCRRGAFSLTWKAKRGASLPICRLDWDARGQTQRPVLTTSAAQVRHPIYNSAVGRWPFHRDALRPLLAELALRT